MATQTAQIQSRAAPAREVRVVRVSAVIPCYGRQSDLDLVLADLRRSDLRDAETGVELQVLVVDNCSEPPLHAREFPGAQVVRLPSNRGGSGGFNAGMARALVDPRVDFLWLVDSDARVEAGTLLGLVRRMLNRPDVVALGCAIADPLSGEVHEVGGVVCRRTGRLKPARRTREVDADDHELVSCDYAASCCLLVRAGAVRATGLMPEVYLNGDDVEWCIRLSDRTGGVVAADPAVLAFHPRFDRFPTWARYYQSRNGFGAPAALGLGRRVRLRRALIETMRAVNQGLMARKDLARLHIRGLADAAFRDPVGPAPERASKFDRFRPLDHLREALGPGEIGARGGVTVHPDVDLSPAQREQLAAALGVPAGELGQAPDESPRSCGGRAWRELAWRIVRGPAFALAVMPARGGPSAWFTGRTQIQLVPEGFAIRRVSRWSALRSTARIAARGLWYSCIIAAQRGRPGKLPDAPTPSASGGPPAEAPPPARLLSIVVLSFNRRGALGETLRALRSDRVTRDAEVIVVDNASGDGSPDLVRQEFPEVRLITLSRNLGVAAFNRGVEAARGDLVLVLDDDAAPEPDALDMAAELLRTREDLAAVALLPRHPDTGVPEWPSAANMPRVRDRWPMMGCGNLVKRVHWLRVGGYESRFFLYRNDTDLALKLLGSGAGVHFNPAWVVWHDSPAAARKSERWLHLATRNWIWLARRHAGGLLWRAHGACFGVMWALRHAGVERSRWRAVWRGAVEGIGHPAGQLPRMVRPARADFASLLRLQVMSRTASRPVAPDAAASDGGATLTSSASSPRHSA